MSEAMTRSVLIVDDDPESLLLVSTMVEYVGYRPVVADQLDPALAALADRPFALVLDLVMPDQTSDRLIDALKAQQNKIPVVLMSAAQRDQLGNKAATLAREGVNVVSTLAKPFWVDVLVTALEQAIPQAPEAVIE